MPPAVASPCFRNLLTLQTMITSVTASRPLDKKSQWNTFSKSSLLLLLMSCQLLALNAFAPASTTRRTLSRAFAPQRPLFQSESSKDSSGAGRTPFMEELRARQLQLDQKHFELEQSWRNADCSSTTQVVVPDWIRRLDVSEYPLVACGTASGTIFVANSETKQILASSHHEEKEDEPIENLEDTMRLLFGEFDGRGTIAIAFDHDLICAANRHGSVDLWRFDPTSERLVSQGSMLALKGVLVTSLHLEEDHLWVGTANGHLQAYPLETDLPLALQRKPSLEWGFNSTILSFSLCPEIDLGVVTTAKGSVELISMEEGGSPIASVYPPFDTSSRSSSNVHPLCASLVAHTLEEDPLSTIYSIACGGSDGSLFLQPLSWKDGLLDPKTPFANRPRQLQPHLGPLKCLANPMSGILVSAGHDGGVRVWDVSSGICLYQLMGYKVWLGSLWTDGHRLLADGSDNAVIVHNFEESADRGDVKQNK